MKLRAEELTTISSVLIEQIELQFYQVHLLTDNQFVRQSTNQLRRLRMFKNTLSLGQERSNKEKKRESHKILILPRSRKLQNGIISRKVHGHSSVCTRLRFIWISVKWWRGPSGRRMMWRKFSTKFIPHSAMTHSSISHASLRLRQRLLQADQNMQTRANVPHSTEDYRASADGRWFRLKLDYILLQFFTYNLQYKFAGRLFYYIIISSPLLSATFHFSNLRAWMHT